MAGVENLYEKEAAAPEITRRDFMKYLGFTGLSLLIPFKIPEAWGLSLEDLEGTEETYELPGKNFSIRMRTLTAPFGDKLKPGMTIAIMTLNGKETNLTYFPPGLAEMVRQAQAENTLLADAAEDNVPSREIPMDAIPFLLVYHKILPANMAYSQLMGQEGQAVMQEWQKQGPEIVTEPDHITIDNWRRCIVVKGSVNNRPTLPLYPIAGMETGTPEGMEEVARVAEAYGFNYVEFSPFQDAARTAKSGSDALQMASLTGSTRNAVSSATQD